LIPKLVGKSIHERGARASSTLPAPKELDFDYWVPQFDAVSLESQLRVVGEQARSLMSLDETTTDQLMREHERWGELRGHSPAGQLEAFRAHDARVQRLLEPSAYERYRTILQSHFEDRLMQQE
jgi:hypothetical protein